MKLRKLSVLLLLVFSGSGLGGCASDSPQYVGSTRGAASPAIGQRTMDNSEINSVIRDLRSAAARQKARAKKQR